jgi:hypothetical protein
LLIWMPFLVPDLASLLNLDRCVRWRPGERRISIGDGSKDLNSAPSHQGQPLLVKGHPQAESAERRVNATECQPKY